MTADECPACGGKLTRHEADIGVGIQYGPWHCIECVWQEAQPGIEERCGATMGTLSCQKPIEHDGPHAFEEDFL